MRDGWGRKWRLASTKVKSCLALDRKCGEPRDQCRLHGGKVEKAVFENWDSR